ncbi:MAG: GNAT family N-acetyltransferase [Planctomycetota bacterium]
MRDDALLASLTDASRHNPKHRKILLNETDALNPADLQRRLIQAPDNPQVAQLIRTVMAEFGCVGQGYSCEDAEVDNMFDAYADSRASFWVIAKDDQILGGGGVAPLEGGPPDVCEIKKMYFYPDIRGLGLGKQLLGHCIDFAATAGYHTCYIETTSQMKSAIRLYKAFGFETLAGPLGNTGHHGCDVCLQLKLTSQSGIRRRNTESD